MSSVATTTAKLSLKEFLIKYGKTAIISHVSLSLVAYIMCYLLVSRGLDVKTLTKKVMKLFGKDQTNEKVEKVGGGVIAYGLYKVSCKF